MRFVILGAGGFARDLYWHLRNTHPGVRVVFVDDVSETREIAIGGEVVPVVKDWRFPDGYKEFVIGVGSPKVKRILVRKALESGLRPGPTIIHPRALVQDPDCQIGMGGIIAPGCVLTTNVRAGDFVLLNLNTTIGHDAVLGDYTTCSPGCAVSGNVVLGEGVTLGTGTTVREQVTIAPGVVTGAQCCVVRDIVEPDITVVGVPAKPIGGT